MLTDLLIVGICSVLAVAWWFFCVPYRQLCVDRARYSLFKIRDSLFDKAVAGVFEFESPAYCMLRTRLNGAIRNIEDLTFPRLLLISAGVRKQALLRKHIDESRQVFEEASAKLSNEARTILLEVEKQMHEVLLVHLVDTSLVLKIGYYVWSIAQTAKSIPEGLNSWRQSRANQIYQIMDADSNWSGHQHAQQRV